MENMPNYPSWRYHPKESPVLVNNKEDDATLHNLWQDTPYARSVQKPVEEPEKAPTPKRARVKK